MKEVKRRWPALEALPEDFAGYLAPNAGIVKARDGLQACKQLSL